MRNSVSVVVLLAAAPTLLFGLTRPYAIDPVSAAMSNWADTVGQTVVCCWDELDSTSGCYVELSCGYHEGNGRYNHDIRDYQTELTVA